jgi:hypothetical protein
MDLSAIASESSEAQLEKLRERLRLMSDDELIAFGRSVRKLAEPRVIPVPDFWKIQLYFALPSFGVFSGGVTNACSGVGLNAEACSRIFDCYLLFRSGGLYQPASWRCPKFDVVQREIGSDRLFQRLVPLFRGENGRPSRRISERHDSELQLENDRSPDLPQLRTSTKRSRRLRH